MDLKIVDIVRDNNPTRFASYRNGLMFYTVSVNGTVYQYPVSLEDIGGASLFGEMKAITLMRYIRKALEDRTFITADRIRKEDLGS